MNFSVENHRLLKDGNPVSSKPSPNHGGAIEPELIVMHYTGDNGIGGLQWLTTKGSRSLGPPLDRQNRRSLAVAAVQRPGLARRPE